MWPDLNWARQVPVPDETIMALSVCLCANTLTYPEGGGHLWVYLNWALGLRALNLEVFWLENVEPDAPLRESRAYAEALKNHLSHYGLADSVALFHGDKKKRSSELFKDYLTVEQVTAADLLLNFSYDISPELIMRFRRSALIDIDPGLTQVWAAAGDLSLPKHDIYFTIGETVGKPGARFPDLGLKWEYTPPCVALDWWPRRQAPPGASFTTVSQWWAPERDGQWEKDGDQTYPNDKRSGFLPYIDLPRRTRHKLELALCLEEDDEERDVLRERGWSVRDSETVAGTPWDYQRYIQNSLGEFSCVKPSCTRFQNAWISDRTLCYLASGKPCVVEHTGPSSFLPDCSGLFRFRTAEEAVLYLDQAASDYQRESSEARALAEEHFDAKRVVRGVLERALD
jgi:hypothetical protein